MEDKAVKHMKKTEKRIKKKIFILLCPILLFIIAIAAWFGIEAAIVANAPDPHETAEHFMASLCAGDHQAAEAIMPGLPAAKTEKAPESDWGKALYNAAKSALSYSLEGNGSFSGRDAEQRVSLTLFDGDRLLPGMNEEINAILADFVEKAERAGDVYDENRDFKPELVEKAFEQVLLSRLENPGEYLYSEGLTLKMNYEKGLWRLQNGAELAALLEEPAALYNADALAEKLFTEAAAELTYVPKRYVIEETALSGRTPDPSCYGVTEDPAVVEALLETPLAKELVGDKKLVWNKDIERLPGTAIHYYLDETILAIVWQEEEALAVGTFAEVIVADGSQLRRRIAGDQFQSFDFKTTSDFAAETNAVLALGGDFYHHDRACGVVVYQREIYRFEPNTSDTCYISADGDMLFSYREQFKSQEEARQFIEDNDVLFSLCFGPVLIDNGQDVTPDFYQWGEINDNYARSALGMLGEKHYLTMNINCQLPDNYYLVTLRQAADAMIERGCVKAYALDGGQTATTVFNGELINPVQFGWEKTISDIIYFATAKP